MYFININPLQTYKRVGGSFVLTPFTQFGEFRIASGIMPGTLTSYPYNDFLINSDGSGYYINNERKIEQWGYTNIIEPPAYASETFPRKFNQCLSVVLGSSAGSATSTIGLSFSNTGFAVYLDEWAPVGNAAKCYYYALGY